MNIYRYSFHLEVSIEHARTKIEMLNEIIRFSDPLVGVVAVTKHVPYLLQLLSS
jgi:hypothetical protein